MAFVCNQLSKLSFCNTDRKKLLYFGAMRLSLLPTPFTLFARADVCECAMFALIPEDDFTARSSPSLSRIQIRKGKNADAELSKMMRQRQYICGKRLWNSLFWLVAACMCACLVHRHTLNRILATQRNGRVDVISLRMYKILGMFSFWRTCECTCWRENVADGLCTLARSHPRTGYIWMETTHQNERFIFENSRMTMAANSIHMLNVNRFRNRWKCEPSVRHAAIHDVISPMKNRNKRLKCPRWNYFQNYRFCIDFVDICSWAVASRQK